MNNSYNAYKNADGNSKFNISKSNPQKITFWKQPVIAKDEIKVIVILPNKYEVKAKHFIIPMSWVTLKYEVPKWGRYPIGVPTGVPLYCSIWSSFWNIIMSYFIYSVMKAMQPGWNFVKRLDRGKASFSCYWHLTFTPQKPNSYITISVSKLQVPCCSSYRGRTFPHSNALLQSLVFAKTHFMWN